MLGELKKSIVHDSALEDFRKPLGALKTGDTVTLRLSVRHSAVKGVKLHLFGEDHEFICDMAAADGAYFACAQMPDTPRVLWYYFVLSTEGGEYYYGARADGIATFGEVYTNKPQAFQLTVYDRAFATPEWLKKGVMYQIFPDRFARDGSGRAQNGIAYHRSLKRTVRIHESWEESAEYLPAEGEKDYYPNDFFMGTLRGIEEKLPYLASLGISVLYLNPIFEADSNHRYNTSDYLKIDPILGSAEDFSSLCVAAKKLGIRLLLDGVFSHTGADSVYFNIFGRYGDGGAYNSKASPYFGWYSFSEYPGKYRSWWGFPSLPEVDEHNKSWQDFIYAGENSVMRRWLSAGAAGYRLDVADELPDDVLCDMRGAVKECDGEAALIGEVWEDATTKQSYGVNRKYALGCALDSVMNYPFRNALCDFLTQRRDAHMLAAFLCAQRLNYPLPMYYSLMNLASSHDIERIRTALSARLDARELTREQQASFVVTEEQNRKGRSLQRLFAAVQFTLPGLPAVYYGDEYGMQGFSDPFNRQPFCERGGELRDYYAKLAKLRVENDALTTGGVFFLSPTPDVLAVLRFVFDGRDAFGEPANNGCFLTVINRAQQKRRVIIDLYSNARALSAAESVKIKTAGFTKAMCLLSGRSAKVVDGLIAFEPDPAEAYLFELT